MTDDDRHVDFLGALCLVLRERVGHRYVLLYEEDSMKHICIMSRSKENRHVHISMKSETVLEYGDRRLESVDICDPSVDPVEVVVSYLLSE